MIATKLFGSEFPDWFGNVGASMYTLFQIMTLESWSMGIVRPVMAVFPHSWVFFIPFIIISSFTVLNLFIAIIVDSLQTLSEDESNTKKIAVKDSTGAEAATPDVNALSSEITALRGEITALRAELRK